MRVDVGLGEIITFEQKRCALGLGAGVGQAVAKIEPRRVSPFAVSLETFDRQSTNLFIDWELGQSHLRR
jgi:hypothetical protein